MGAIWPRVMTRTPRGGLPAALERLGDLRGGPAQVLALDIGRDAQVTLHGRCGHIRPASVPFSTLATSRTIKFNPGLTCCNGMVSTCAAESMRWVGTCTCTW